MLFSISFLKQSFQDDETKEDRTNFIHGSYMLFEVPVADM